MALLNGKYAFRAYPVDQPTEYCVALQGDKKRGRGSLTWWIDRHGTLACVLAALAGTWSLAAAVDARGPLLAMITLASLLALAGAALRDAALHTRARRAARLARSASTTDAGGDDIDTSLDRLAGLVGAVEQRVAQRHATTGLATREPLLAAIGDDIAAGGAGGLLGIIEFADFDRLNAFDCALADHALAMLADRITRMVGPRRPVGQVDRARIAIWLGADLADDAARAELAAIGYALASAMEVDGQSLIPELRIASARHGVDGDTPDMLVTRGLASLAASGAVGVRSVDPGTIARHGYTLEQDLRQAVARGQFDLAYQPLIDGVRQRVCGAEALLRWRHPDHGMISPADFVPIAEGLGLADEIGMWTLNAACREARSWQKLGAGDLHVAVNLSAHQLHRDDLPTLIERTLARQRLAPALLEIELTETAAAGDVTHTRALFARLRALGVRIAIDDFGTGYSSLSYLRNLTFDKIKIDREFVTDVDSRRDSQAICQSLIALGRGLGIRVLAEGVERREEYEWLRRHGCALFQGYLFARPLTAADFAAFAGDAAAVTRATAVSPAALQDHLIERLSA